MRARRRRSDAIIGGPKAQRWRAVLRLAAASRSAPWGS
jgi:hypothetical protein